MSQAKEIMNQLLIRYPRLEECREDIWNAYVMMKESFSKQGKLLICGNGGSYADAQHIVGELMKEFTKRRGLDEGFAEACGSVYPEDHFETRLQAALPAIALGSSGVLTSAYSNDVDPSMIYAQEVFGYGVKGDVLMGLSTSGNSANVVNAVKVAKLRRLKTIGVGGQSGGKMKELCHVYVALPEKETYKVQELTLPVYHAWCMMLEEELFRNGRSNERN